MFSTDVIFFPNVSDWQLQNLWIQWEASTFVEKLLGCCSPCRVSFLPAIQKTAKCAYYGTRSIHYALCSLGFLGSVQGRGLAFLILRLSVTTFHWGRWSDDSQPPLRFPYSPFFFFFFFYYRRIVLTCNLLEKHSKIVYYYLFSRKIGNQPLACSPKTCNSKDWVRPKAGTGNMVRFPMWRAGTQVLETTSAVCQGGH